MNKKKPIDILQGKFRHFTGDVELDDENEDLTDRVYSGETIVGGKKKMYWTEDGWKEGEKEKYDFEGSLDDFEIWLKNWQPNKEENNMIKLKEILLEDIDRDIKKNINEMGEISKEISLLQDKLKPLQKRYGDIVKEVLPVVNQLGKENVITKKYVFRILKKGFDRKTVSYKEGFTNALEKVNRSTRIVLFKILKETEKLSYVKPQFSIKPVEGIGDTLKKWVNKFKMLVRKISPSLKKIKDGNKELRKMV